MKNKRWKELIVAVLLITTIVSFSPVAYGETTSVQQSMDAVKMEMKQAALAYVEPAHKGELVSSSALYPLLNSVKKNYEKTRKIIQASNLSEKEKQVKLKELEVLYEEKIVKGLISYIDAYNYATKYLEPLLKEIKEAEAKNDFVAVEKAYHKLSVQLKSRTSILYRFTGKATRDLLLEKYKKPADAKRDELIIPVTIIMKATTAQQLLLAGKKEEAQKAIEEIQALAAKLSSTNPFHQALLKELGRLQAIVFPSPVAPVVPTPPVTPPSTGGSGDNGGSSETSAQRALRLAKADAIAELENYKEADYSSTNWTLIKGYKVDGIIEINAATTTATVAKVLADVQKEINDVKTLVEEQQDQQNQELVNAEAAKIPLTFAPTQNFYGTVSLPTVGADYTISVKSTSDPSKYDMDGKIKADGSSTVVYTVTHKVSGKTADTGLVDVTTLIILKVPPVVNTVLPSPVPLNSLIEFTFIDNPQWRAAFERLEIVNKIGPSIIKEERIVFGNGTLKVDPGNYGTTHTWVWTFKASGYQDVIITLEVLPRSPY